MGSSKWYKVGLDVTMWDYMARTMNHTPLWEYKQPFRHRALLYYSRYGKYKTNRI